MNKPLLIEVKIDNKQIDKMIREALGEIVVVKHLKELVKEHSHLFNEDVEYITLSDLFDLIDNQVRIDSCYTGSN